MKRFISIFPAAENIHLSKDVGLIPYILGKHFGYQSTIASYRQGEYPTLSKELLGLRQIFIKKVFNNEMLDVLVFLLLNFRRYDVINVYHLMHRSWIWGFFFKMLTLGRGKVYLKLDAGPNILNYNPLGIKRLISNLVFAKIDLISIENREFATYFNTNRLMPVPVFHIPNGYYAFYNSETVQYQEKENLIITVGRIGTYQKATEILCAAFRLFAAENTDWKLEVIGPIEPLFQMYIAEYFKENPFLIHRVIFTGNITDREVLECRYRRAKVFAATSRDEGFPNVFVEAVWRGCYIVSTDLPAAQEVTDYGRYGSLFKMDDHQSLSDIFIDISRDDEKLKLNCQAVQKFAHANYDFIKICGHINYLLES